MVCLRTGRPVHENGGVLCATTEKRGRCWVGGFLYTVSARFQGDFHGSGLEGGTIKEVGDIKLSELQVLRGWVRYGDLLDCCVHPHSFPEMKDCIEDQGGERQ